VSGVTQTYDVCPWPVDAGCFDEEWETQFDETVQTRSIALASSTLQRLTAYRVSNCTTILRPCSDHVGCSPWTGQYRHWSHPTNYDSFMFAYNWAGAWFNACGCSANSCGHTPTNTVWLPTPMGGVETVKLDGVTLTDGTDYRVEGTALIAMGTTVWPLTQDLTLLDSEPGTFSVEFYNCIRPDGTAQYACALLALQYARACTGKGGKCTLPTSVTSVVRQGVSFTLPTGSFPNGETGIREVDAFIALYNPKHRIQAPQAYVP
jgi:hypothetical protein